MNTVEGRLVFSPIPYTDYNQQVRLVFSNMTSKLTNELEPVSSLTEKSRIASYYRQISMNIKIKILKLIQEL